LNLLQLRVENSVAVQRCAALRARELSGNAIFDRTGVRYCSEDIPDQDWQHSIGSFGSSCGDSGPDGNKR